VVKYAVIVADYERAGNGGHKKLQSELSGKVPGKNDKAVCETCDPHHAEGFAIVDLRVFQDIRRVMRTPEPLAPARAPAPPAGTRLGATLPFEDRQ
jgi:hypothetical protein